MAQVARYQPQRLFAEHDAVKTFHGLDPLTGLPVLIYRFAGRPTAKVGELKSEAIPAILTSNVESGRGQLVVAYARGYEPLHGSVAPHEVAGLLRDSAAALYDAARTSVVHGDLRPERFLKANDHVMVEGYGVPWAAWDAASEFSAPERIGGASAKSDVFSWARSVQFLAGRHLPKEVADLIAACLDADPKRRPNAETIYKRLVEPEVEPIQEEKSPFDDLDFSPAEEETFSNNPFRAPNQPGRKGTVAVLPDKDAATPQLGAVRSTKVARGSGSGESLSDPAADDPFGFGTFDERPRSTLSRGARGRRTALLIALVIGLLVLGALAFFNRTSVGEAVSTALDIGVSAVLGVFTGIGRSDTSGAYLVNVEMVPANLEAQLFIVESPAGSSLPSGRPISIVPGSTVLDRTGLWRLQAQVGERRSEIEEVRVPEERTVTFTVPWTPASDARGRE